jgi:regulation of enolase protein 1 (concanavalin A-like superfamily)
MDIFEQFLGPELPANFTWFNEPARFRLGHGLEIETKPQTDFWQRTHYGFQRDDGHCLLVPASGDFSLTTRVEWQPRRQYDQCGLMVRVDSQHWLKLSTEFEDETVSRLGSVVTNLGYSDWATQDVSSAQRARWYRINKCGPDFLLESSADGVAWAQVRIAHLHRLTEPLAVGVYACSPIGQDFWCRFEWLRLGESTWGGE